jgi:hypothetical protein
MRLAMFQRESIGALVMKRKGKPGSIRRSGYGAMIALTLLAGAAPAALVAGVDPYGLVGGPTEDSREAEIAEKAHYPLWKLARYQRGRFDTVVLGDSRARALRDKYWHELGRPDAINLAYGGATIPEIYETFRIVRDDPSVRTLVVGIQLRSFDEDHKGGLNRVPEAVKLTGNRVEYLKNWFVARIALRVFAHRHEDTLRAIDNAVPRLVGEAHAAELGAPGKTRLEELLRPDLCFGCRLPANLESAPLPAPSLGLSGRWAGIWGRGHGYRDPAWGERWAAWYDVTVGQRDLPHKIANQVKKNAKSDWEGFAFSPAYWAMIEEMGEWARQPGNRLVFVIPPTIAELQRTIAQFGLSQENHDLRARLAALGDVVDLDFQNEVTVDPEQFTDAYHFNSKVARQIVGEVVLLLDGKEAAATAMKRRGELRCPLAGTAAGRQAREAAIAVEEGKACRIWKEAANG